jgi:hypothetical protein
VKARGVVICGDNIAVGGGNGHLALREVKERAEAGEDLDIIQLRIVHLHIAATKLDLGYSRTTARRVWRVGQNDGARGRFVLQDAPAGPHVDVDPQLGEKAERRPALRENRHGEHGWQSNRGRQEQGVSKVHRVVSPA